MKHAFKCCATFYMWYRLRSRAKWDSFEDGSSEHGEEWTTGLVFNLVHPSPRWRASSSNSSRQRYFTSFHLPIHSIIFAMDENETIWNRMLRASAFILSVCVVPVRLFTSAHLVYHSNVSRAPFCYSHSPLKVVESKNQSVPFNSIVKQHK